MYINTNVDEIEKCLKECERKSEYFDNEKGQAFDTSSTSNSDKPKPPKPEPPEDNIVKEGVNCKFNFLSKFKNKVSNIFKFLL